MHTPTQQIGSIQDALLGAWRLASFYTESVDGKRHYPLGPAAQGLLIYTECGTMSAQIMAQDRPLFKGSDQLNGTPSEMTENFKGCVSYFGRYEVDASSGFVLHHVEQSLFPNWEGAAQQRFISLEGDNLSIRTPPLTWGGEGTVGVLEWKREGAR